MNNIENLSKKRAKENIKLIYNPTRKFYLGNEMVRKKYEFNELLSVSTLALYKASEKFDENKGFKFSTYAVPLIQYALIEFTRKDKWYFNRTKIEGIEKFEPVERVSTSALIKDSTSINGNKDLTIEDSLQDDTEVYTNADNKMMVDFLLSTCIERERAILIAYFYDEKPQSQLAKEFKTSQSFISLVIKRNLKRFKDILGDKEVLEYAR